MSKLTYRNYINGVFPYTILASYAVFLGAMGTACYRHLLTWQMMWEMDAVALLTALAMVGAVVHTATYAATVALYPAVKCVRIACGKEL